LPVVKLKIFSHVDLPSLVPKQHVLREVRKIRGIFDVRLSDEVLAGCLGKKIMYKTQVSRI
jgi:hypothetical protein